jgi:DnaA-homolog protein
MSTQLPLGLRWSQEFALNQFVSPIPGFADMLLRHLGANRQAGMILHGAHKTGKTHLALGLYQALQTTTDSSVVFVAGGQITARALDDIADGAKTILIDDAHMLFTHRDLCERLFVLANKMLDGRLRLLLTSVTAAGMSDVVLPDLQSRMQQMHHYPLMLLNDAELERALVLKARIYGIELSADIVRFLTSQVSRDLAALTKQIKDMDAAALAQKRKLTLAYVRSYVQTL